MPWTTPRTFVTGEVETAAIFNAHLRDNLNMLAPFMAAWTTSAPAQTGITLGNGTNVLRSITIGKTVFFQWTLTFGSTTTLGAGSNGFTLPVAAFQTGWRFNAVLTDAGVNNYPAYARMTVGTSTTTVELVYRTTAALVDALVVAGTPVALAVGDSIVVSGSYETV